MVMELYIIIGCILLLLAPTLFFYRKFRKPVASGKAILKAEIKKIKSHSYIYAIKHESFEWDVYKIGKTTRSPRARMRAYETSHQTPPDYVLLYKVNHKKLTKAEDLLKSYFRSSGRLAIQEKVRKEMFRFDSLYILYSEVDKVLKMHKIGYIDLLNTGEYNNRGTDLKPGNNL
jgi:T5orf172 domain